MAFAQIKERTLNFPSPNAAGLGLYGQVPVNYYTGIPNIEIPIYQIKNGDISVPITLSYHIASVKLNAHPGWTGLGWNLRAGGVITRMVHGGPDEVKTTNGHEYGYYFNHNKADVSNWSSVAKLEKYAEDLLWGEPNYELMADVFHFNFLGYSGKFYLDHTGEWVVQSDSPIKVVFEPNNGGFISKNDLRNPIGRDMPYPSNLNDNYFNKFTLVTGDGTRYEFGGVNATEYSTSYRDPLSTYVIPTSWYLVKIVSPTNKVVEFQYQPGQLICSLTNGYNYLKYNRPGGGWFSLNPSCSATISNFARNPAQGYLIFPVYLRKISGDNVNVVFNRSNTLEMRYLDYDLGPDPFNSQPYNDFYIYFTNIDELQWEKLDEIEILSKDDVLFKKYILEYTNSEDERLKLLSLVEQNADTEFNKTYSFVYNPGEMSRYCSDQLDHWGFFNGYDVNLFQPDTPQEWIQQYYSTREPDLTGEFNKYETLEKIIYPTGGYTVFEYEPHSYRKVVKKERTGLNLLTNNKLAGGLRMKRIKSFDYDQTLLLEREFLYVKSYNGQDPSTLASSGILSGLSQYYWPTYSGKDLDGNTFTYEMFSSSSLLPSPFDGSHIGYSEVIEKITGDGYIKYTFTNFDEDIYGTAHLDEAAIAWVENDRSIYSPFTDKSLERGKLTSKITFDKNNNEVQKLYHHYEKSSSNYIRGIFTEHLNICSGVTASAQTWFGTSFKYYTYNFDVVKTEVFTVDPDDEDRYLKNITEYECNENNLISKRTFKTSENKSIITSFTYPTDYLTGQNHFPLKEMIELNMVNPVIEKKMLIKDHKSERVISARLNIYKTDDGLIVPDKLLTFTSNNGVTDFYDSNMTVYLDDFNRLIGSFHYDDRYIVETTFNEYDNGNLLKKTARNGLATTYEWGYNNSLLKSFTINPGTTLQQKTTFTHNPLVGMTSKTDPNGSTTYYEYDDFGRLKNIKDFDGHILKSYRYHFLVR